MDSKELPFVLELTQEQRQLLLQVVLAVDLSGKFEQIALTVDALKPIVEQLRGE